MGISREQIVSDFKENLDFLLRKKVSTKPMFHHRRAGVVGSLAFLVDQIEKQSEAAWVYAGRDVTRMDLRYRRDIAIGYNASHDAYKDQ
jgi:hypothetical protein